MYDFDLISLTFQTELPLQRVVNEDTFWKPATCYTWNIAADTDRLSCELEGIPQVGLKASKQAFKQPRKEGSKQACEQATRQANKRANEQSGKQANKQTSKQASKQTGKPAIKQTTKQAS